MSKHFGTVDITGVDSFVVDIVGAVILEEDITAPTPSYTSDFSRLFERQYP